MNILTVGIGECGRNIALQLYYQLSSMRYKILMKNFNFFITDSENIVRLRSDIEHIGISKEVINPEKMDEKTKPLNVFMLSPGSSYAGVGGAWILSYKMAHEFLYNETEENKKYLDSIDFSTKFVECFNIFNSAGGGTGCGAGPVFLEYMRTKSAMDTSRRLYTATIVLPFDRESGGWRDVNTAINIARYSKLCDGILIGDNEHLKNLMKQDIKSVQKGANEILSNIWIWMNACSSTHLIVSPKRWEGADFKRTFTIGDFGAPIVPCYREEPIETLKRINIGWIVLRTIKENCAAECLPSTSKRILVIVSIPDNVSFNFSESDIKDYIGKELLKGESSSVDIIFIKGKSMLQASITAFLVAPRIPRLEKLESNFRAYLENKELFEKDLLVTGVPKEEIWNACKNEHENFKKYLEYLGV